MPKISIIVPVYNVEKYLNRCVDSILSQTFTDFECILIDDGSPDNCPAICDEYAKKDNRIKVIHQKNAGVSAARNAGLDVAKGEWIGFVDSDDWIDMDYLENFNLSIKENKKIEILQTDVVVTNNSDIYKIKEWNEIFKIDELRENMPYASCWGKLFNQLFLKKNQIFFKNDLSYGEDLCFMLNCYCKTNLVHNIHKKSYYYYFENLASVVHRPSHKNITDHLKSIQYSEAIVYENNRERDFSNIIVQHKLFVKRELSRVNFNLYRNTFPELNPLMLHQKEKSVILYILLYFHLDVIADILVRFLLKRERRNK